MAARNFTEEWLNGRLDKARVKEQSASSFSLDPQEIYLPFPPSVNGMYANVPGKGRVKSERLRSWEQIAGYDINRQKPKRIKGPVELSIYLQEPDTARKKDCSNFIKAVEDLLVSRKIIEADDSKIVRKVSACWSPDTRGCRVSIRPAPVHGSGG
jgi:Holliday junction resolvase RusA-like endonuclease